MATRAGAAASQTVLVPPAAAPRLRAWLEQQSASGETFTFRDLDHAFWQARAGSAVISFYRSGKVLVQGPATAEWARRILDSDVPAHANAKPQSLDLGGHSAPQSGFDPPPADTWIGIDETGKGDYFGPLVACAVRLERKDLGWLAELGVGDSKGIDDVRIAALAPQLAAAVPHEIVRISPQRYNELYEKFGNLNQLLAWAHATAAEKVLETHSAQAILSDQFSPQPIVPRYFRGPGRDVRFLQRPKAEGDAAVACASILARNAFLQGMRALEKQYGVTLHKGAGDPVLAAGRALVRTHGTPLLQHVAKLHFKTTQQLRG